MNRRKLLASGAAVAVGGLGLAAATKFASAGVDNTAVAATDPAAVEPAFGAGLFDVDPDQGNVSQSPDVAVTGDVSALSEDWGF